MKWRRKLPKPEMVVEMERRYGKAKAWGTTTDGDLIVAVRDGLVGESSPMMQWHCIDHAAWDPPQLTVRHRDPSSGAPKTLRLELAEPGELPPIIRSAVTESVLISRRIPLQGDLGAVAAARRDPAGAITWTVVFDAGLDHTDPDLRQRAREALAELRHSYGA